MKLLNLENPKESEESHIMSSIFFYPQKSVFLEKIRVFYYPIIGYLYTIARNLSLRK